MRLCDLRVEQNETCAEQGATANGVRSFRFRYRGLRFVPPRLNFWSLGGIAPMFATELHVGDAPPTVAQYIFGSLFGLLVATLAVWMIVALFSDRQLSKFHWGKGREGRPVSRLSILMILPLFLFIPARYCAWIIGMATGHEGTWAVPNWWFFPCVALFLLGAIHDSIARRGRNGS